jgi:hypothetical protein
LEDEEKCAGGWKQPFPFEIKSFPVENHTDMMNYDLLADHSKKHDQHIPAHLPPFPPLHTYTKRPNKKRSSELSSSSSLSATAKRPKAIAVKGALTALASIEESADAQS